MPKKPAGEREPADLAQSLRDAVEHLLRVRLPADAPVPSCDPQELYLAAGRFIMRLVVVLCGEGRGLLPTNNPRYARDYGLCRLLQELAGRDAGLRRLGTTAWPRLLRLFRLLHAGSADPELPLPSPGGTLFRPGDADGETSTRALAWLESPAEPPSDDAVYELLRRLTQPGRRAATDYATVPGEQLGICYQGLLNGELQPLASGALPCVVAAGGARKGSGSFYTPVQLSVPAVRRTLEPLFYGPAAALRTPQELLALRICDPAMGCGAFLLAALRVLIEAVTAALAVHGTGALPQVAERQPAGPGLVRRLVAERCLYGVDLDPLAVDLARLALWLETAEPHLPLGFADPKLRCGDALLGTFVAELSHYPLVAWKRPIPDESWRGPRPSGGTWAHKLKRLRAKVRAEYQATESLPQCAPQDALRQRCDLRCALWFWPLDRLDDAPRPAQLQAPSKAALEVAQTLARARRFFHWELEFSDVFTGPAAGFDAIVGNPPWEIRKPSSQEFFSALDPSYRTYGKQRALARQRELFAADARVERQWLEYESRYKDTAHFIRHAFVHQGDADLNSYKLFVEQAYRLLRTGGQLGLLVPSGLYTDQGSRELRRLLLTRCSWRILYGFQNERRIFPGVHHAFKQCLIVAAKTPPKGSLEVMFRLGVAESPTASELPAQLGPAWQPVPYPLALAKTLSPQSLALVELRSFRDLELLTKIYAGSTLLGEPGPGGFGVEYASEFHLTSSSHLFIAKEKALQDGYKADAYGRWRGPQGQVLLPLYQGVMFYGLSPSVAVYQGGAGHAARWTRTEDPGAPLGPQFLLPAELHRPQGGPGGTKVAFRTLANATNERTLVACLLPELPCGNSVGVLRIGDGGLLAHALATACLGSLVYDYALRQRIGGTNINFCFLRETGWPTQGQHCARWLLPLVLGLCAPAWRYAPLWLGAQGLIDRVQWAQTRHERLRLRCILDAAVAALYGLSSADLHYILRGCAHPQAQLAVPAFCRTLDPKGFWRIDRDQDPELRHPVLTLVAFVALEKLLAENRGDRRAAIAAFVSLPDGEGWMLPETLCLADYGLGTDQRARQPQPVQGRLGARLADWQLRQTGAQGFAECARHARAMAL